MTGVSSGVYERLAARLDAIPNGFPRTASGVEARILEKLFRPEEAALAAVMRMGPEPTGTIAERVRQNPAVVQPVLQNMVARGLILSHTRGGEERFGLMPWVVGIYEMQLTSMDEELAQMAEVYLREGMMGLGAVTPALHRVIPVAETVPFGVEVAPYEQLGGILESARSFGVRDCLCRVQRRLIGHACEHPVENCVVFSHHEEAFAHAEGEGIRPIPREEAMTILRQARDAGLVHTVNNIQGRHSYICNCCTCSCGLLRSVVEFGVMSAVVHSALCSRVDADLCTGCGDCVERCPFGALALVDDLCHRDAMRCMGCGQCVLVCPAGALSLEPRPAEQAAPPPRDRMEWLVQRAQERGLSLKDVL